MVCPSTSATLVAGSIPLPDFAPPVLQATEVRAQTAKACKTLLFMTVSRRGEPRTLGGRAAYVNKREALGVPESQPRRDQGAAPAHQDRRGGRALPRSGPAVLQRRQLPAGKRLPDRSHPAGRRRDPRRAGVREPFPRPLRRR